jgi:MFS family permease
MTREGTTAVPGRARLADLPAAFWWLWLAELVTWTGRFVVPFLTLYLTRHAGFDAGQAGLVVACYGVGSGISMLAGGVLADRFGRRVTLVSSVFASAAILCAIPRCDGSVEVSLLLFLYGLGNGAGYPLVTTIVGDLVPAGRRTAAFLYITWAVNLGYGIGPVLAGFLAGVNFALLFYAQAIALVVAGAIVVMGVPETHRAQTRARAIAEGSGLRPVLRDRVFLVLLGAMCLYDVVYQQSTTTLPVALARQGLSSRDYGLLLALNGLLLCALQVPSVRVLTRLRRETVIAGFMLLVGLGLVVQSWAAALPAGPAMPAYLASVAVWTLGELGLHPSAQLTAAELAPAWLRGRYQGAYALVWAGATIAAPVAGGVMLDRLGPRALWLSGAVICGLVACALAATGGQRERRVQYVISLNRRHDEVTTSYVPSAPGS